MRRRTSKSGLLASGLVMSVLSSGCDKEALEFATQTAVILQQRSEQLARKIAAETNAYNTVAAVASEAHRDLVDSSLRNERVSRSSALAADYDEGRRPVSRWQSDLADYGQLDNARTRELLSADIDAGTLFLQKVQLLKIEQDKVDALAKLLSALAKQPTLTQDLAALGSFAQDTKTEFDKKVCDALAKDGSAAAKAALAAKGCK